MRDGDFDIDGYCYFSQVGGIRGLLIGEREEIRGENHQTSLVVGAVSLLAGWGNSFSVGSAHPTDEMRLNCIS